VSRLGNGFPEVFSCWLLRGLSVEEIVGVQEEARRAFGLETQKLDFGARFQVRGVVCLCFKFPHVALDNA